MLSTDPQERKQTPIYSGVLKYFPNALASIARTSWVGNEQHNPGEPLHWAREKSTDQLDAAVRHIVDDQFEKIDVDGIPHLAKAAWRILAQLQLDEEERDALRRMQEEAGKIKKDEKEDDDELETFLREWEERAVASAEE